MIEDISSDANPLLPYRKLLFFRTQYPQAVRRIRAFMLAKEAKGFKMRFVPRGNGLIEIGHWDRSTPSMVLRTLRDGGFSWEEVPFTLPGTLRERRFLKYNRTAPV